MIRFLKSTILLILLFVSINIAYASLVPLGYTPGGKIYSLFSSPTPFALPNSYSNPTRPALVPLDGLINDPNQPFPSSVYFLEIYSAQKKICLSSTNCYASNHLLWNIFSRKGSLPPEYQNLSNGTFGVGVEPSIIPIGTTGYYLEVNSTQGNLSIQAYLLHVTNNGSAPQLSVINDVNVGRGSDPSVASIGNNNFLIVSNSSNNTLAGYVVQATVSGVSELKYSKTYANGNTASIVSVGNGKLLETDNNYSSGNSYHIITATQNSITSTVLPLANQSESAIKNPYTNIELLPINQEGSAPDTTSILAIYSMPEPDGGLWSQVLSYNNSNNTLTSAPGYQYLSNGSSPAIAPNWQSGSFLEVYVGQSPSSNDQILLGNLLY